jgi:patatin-like phospholipase/acyl hydrolase
MSNDRDKLIKVLCIDGGGARGIIPATVLEHFETQTQKPIHQLFDLIIGTSTGGILALAITMPDPMNPTKAMYSARDLVRFYIDKCSQIFHNSIIRKIATGFGLWGSKYNRKYLDDILKELLQDSKISQALCNVGVLSYCLEKESPTLWTNYAAKAKPYKDHYISDIAGATSAAPTYFAPKVIPTKGEDETLTEIDGGIYANNPSVAGMIGIKELYPDFETKELVIVSIGTGKELSQKHSNSGLGGISHLISDMMDGNSDLLDIAFKAIVTNYHRFQVSLPKKFMALDKGDITNMTMLAEYTLDMLKTKQEQINGIYGLLLE